MSKKVRNYEQYYVPNKGHTLTVKEGEEKVLIPMVLFNKSKKGNIYICLLPKDMELDGEKYHKGTIVVWNAFGNKYDIITDPKYDNKYFNSDIYKNWESHDIFNFRQTLLGLRDINAEDFAKYTKFLKNENTQSWLERDIALSVKSILHSAIGNLPVGDISGDTSGASGTLTTEYNSSSPTDSSSSVSFDFIDDILGTKSTDAEKGNTDYDPNEVANNTVSNSSLSKIRKDTVNELVLAYSKAMQGILDNYGNKDMYNLYSRDSI